MLPGAGDSSVPGKAFEFFRGARPVGAKEARKRAVGEKLAGGLAIRTIVGFVRGVAYALNPGITSGAGLLVATVNRHAFAKRCDFFGEGDGGGRVGVVRLRV